MSLSVSVILTNYNYGRYLAQAVASALNQTLPVDQIVIVDDGSMDESRAVIERLSQEYPHRLRVILQENAGQAAAINSGYKACTGEIVCMLDADDVWDSMKIEDTCEAFARTPDAAMSMHRLRHIDADGTILRAVGCGKRPSGDLSSLMIKTGGSWIFGATSSLSFRRSALDQILPIPATDWRLCADGALAYSAAMLGPVITLDDVLGSYRIHGNNNHYNAAIDKAKTDASIEMSNRYINTFLTRIKRPERIDLNDNLNYRREKFYQQGGSAREAAAILGLIARWPLYNHLERAKFAARFMARAAATWARGSARTATSSL